MCLRIIVDAVFCIQWLARLTIFIHADIGSEWQSATTTVGKSLPKHCYTNAYLHIFLIKCSMELKVGLLWFVLIKYRDAMWLLSKNSLVILTDTHDH